MKKQIARYFKSINVLDTIKVSLLILILIICVIQFSNSKKVEQGSQIIDYPIESKIFSLSETIVFTDCLRAEWFVGNSMIPTIEPNQYVLVDICYPKEQLKEGDVIAFVTESINDRQKIMHRIVEINYKDKWVKTKGDNNPYIDDIKSFDLIYGKKLD